MYFSRVAKRNGDSMRRAVDEEVEVKDTLNCGRQSKREITEHHRRENKAISMHLYKDGYETQASIARTETKIKTEDTKHN